MEHSLFITKTISKVMPTITIVACVFLSSGNCFADETIVMIRHGEKPDAGLGQLNCQGLNRSLALPKVLKQKFDTPTAIYAPNPGIQKNDRGTLYNYIRPLATIEPTAISLGMPVNTQFGLDDIGRLNTALLSPAYANATIIVAWEHRLAEEAARNILAMNGGDPATVPTWKGNDFDSIYIVDVKANSNGQRIASFRLDAQGLNHLSTNCNN
ncbi:histidine phosphatase family protein [Undibacterium sp. SXout20W]|uniref:histidine phosphatase family protein n=1 Tax=Undibacterium sp. SXout20W TaxID=3413051 RepID=UPI003BF39BDE